MNAHSKIDLAQVNRILIVGVTGSGKTTLSRQLAERTGLPHVELDVLHWGPNWTMRPEFAEEALAAIARERWIVEGGYSRIKAAAWPRAELVIWLDYSFLLILRRLLTRIFVRRARDETLYAGNRESLRTHFFTRDSLILWLFNTYRPRRKEHAALCKQHAGVPVLHFQRLAETERWLSDQAM